ncbi:hypothetical protein DFS34DRAFT_691025 [Phlyctochytrium arcticum]|nr:hypothetical protein DFS34DRAFT_691025 [Phlyctochytrium arcticum]
MSSIKPSNAFGIHEADAAVFFAESEQTSRPIGLSFIMIPHLDPGYDKYGQQPVQLRRVYDLTWHLSIYILNQALVLAAQTPADHDTLVKALYEQSKQDLQRYQDNLRATRGPRSLPEFTPQVRALMSEQSKERMIRGQQAAGAPRSPERNLQVQSLWKMQLPDVMLHLPPDTTDRESVWKRWALGLPTGTFYYASSLNRTQFIRPTAGLSQSVMNAIRMFRPQNVAVNNDRWMSDPSLVKEALLAKGRNMASLLAPGFFSSEQQRQRRLNALRGSLYEFHAKLEGRQVAIQAKGTMELRWKDVSNMPATDFVFPSIAQIDGDSMSKSGRS